MILVTDNRLIEYALKDLFCNCTDEDMVDILNEPDITYENITVEQCNHIEDRIKDLLDHYSKQLQTKTTIDD